MKIKLSVIIVSYRKIDILRDCLDSIKKFNDIGDELEVIVSDNSEDNQLVETLSREYDWIKITKNDNIGFGAGNNRGYEISSGEYLLFLNPDTILVEPIFKFTIEKFENNPDLALFGVQLLNKQGKKNDSFFLMDKNGILASFKSKLCRKLGRYVDGKMFLCGANLFMRRASFIEAGMFDENIFMYKEEADLIKRIKLHSSAKRTAFFKNKHIIHLEGGTETSSDIQIITQLKRILDADKYYAVKWNMSYVKILKQRRRYQRFKLFIYRCLIKKSKISRQKDLIFLLNERIAEAEGSYERVKS